MLEIKPVQDKGDQEKYALLCGAVYDADCLAYAAFEVDAGNFESKSFLGISQFRIMDGYAVFCTLTNAREVDDLEALIIMGRATLNFIDLLGIKKVLFESNEINGKMPKILGFKPSPEGYELHLEGYFDHPCKNGTKDKK